MRRSNWRIESKMRASRRKASPHAAPIVEQPANRVRSIARLFTSDVEDKPWYNDREMWPQYLTMLAAQRFNRFHLALRHRLRLPRARHRRLLSVRLSVSAVRARLQRARARNCPTPSATAIWKCCSSSASRPWRAGIAFPARPLDARLRVDRQPESELHDRRAHARKRTAPIAAMPCARC